MPKSPKCPPSISPGPWLFSTQPHYSSGQMFSFPKGLLRVFPNSKALQHPLHVQSLLPSLCCMYLLELFLFQVIEPNSISFEHKGGLISSRDRGRARTEPWGNLEAGTSKISGFHSLLFISAPLLLHHNIFS